MMTKCSFKRPFVLDVGDQQSGRERPRVQGAGSGSAPKRGSLTPGCFPCSSKGSDTDGAERRPPRISHSPKIVADNELKLDTRLLLAIVGASRYQGSGSRRGPIKARGLGPLSAPFPT